MNPEHITWIYIPSAILLGALHGLEPGHSKTMMAAFIIAIRGTFMQAIILGTCAALSHSLIIWVLAGGALYFGQQWDAATFEPYMQLFSAVAILTMAFWMFSRTNRDLHEAHHHHGHSHSHDHDHGHGHGHAHHHHEDGIFLLHVGHQHVELSIFEDGVPPVFRLRAPAGEPPLKAREVSIETTRPDGAKKRFTFAAKGGFLESTEEIPEPHEFEVLISVAHGNHSHSARCTFQEGEHHHEHAHGHGHETEEDFQDAHEREHAEDIRRRFEGRTITTPQIALFGITGGLMPCPAAFSVLLICLQLKKFTLGFAMVAAFSFGLALTMVTTGLLAAWSVHHAERRFKGFGEAMRKAPYISCVLLIVVATYMAWHGWHGLQQAHGH